MTPVLPLAGCGTSSKPEAVASTHCNVMNTFDAETVSECLVAGEPDFDDVFSSEKENDGTSLAVERIIKFFETNGIMRTYEVGTAAVEGDMAMLPVLFA